MELTGTAGRSLGRRIGAVRGEKDRAHHNDNAEMRPAEAPRGAEGKAKCLAGNGKDHVNRPAP